MTLYLGNQGNDKATAARLKPPEHTTGAPASWLSPEAQHQRRQTHTHKNLQHAPAHLLGEVLTVPHPHPLACRCFWGR
jgi:hypothetical protein